jgi:glycogen debranching enzyme
MIQLLVVRRLSAAQLAPKADRTKGEMAALRELPFAQYYGGVDTTPLFVMLAGAYATRTGAWA